MSKQRPRPLTAIAMASLLTAAMLVAGCSASRPAPRVPTARTTIPTPTELTNAEAFDCAQLAITELSKTSSSWPEVSLRDDAHGVLESGDYAADDKTGFRMRLRRTDAGASLQINLKGAGAYYADLGVQKAIHELGIKIERCIHGRGE